MTDDLAATLDAVAAELAEAVQPWWVIGSAAALLHGAATQVADVDVLLSLADAERLAQRWNVDNEANDDGRFRSDVFARWPDAPLPVEIMAGLTVRGRPVTPRTRERIGSVWVPSRGELVSILRRFGRPKDVARADLLEQPAP